MSAAGDAIALLEADHAALEQLFADYQALVKAETPAARRKALADQICVELAVHTKLEDEFFYPAARAALADAARVDELEREHGGTKDMVAQILAMRADDELFDARVAVLHSYVTRHARHEREQLFTPLRERGADLRALARALAERKQELQTVADALREDALASAMA